MLGQTAAPEVKIVALLAGMPLVGASPEPPAVDEPAQADALRADGAEGAG